MKMLKDSIWNITATIVSGLLVIPTYAFMSRHLSVEHFGFVLLIFTFLGYASILDVGISRSVTLMVAINYNSRDMLNDIYSTSQFFMLLIGIFIGINVWIFSGNISNLLNVGVEYVEIYRRSIELVGISLPIILITQAYIGFLEGLNEFKKLAIYKIISTIFTCVLPVILIIYYKNNVYYIVVAIVFSRLLSLMVLLYFLKSYGGIFNIKLKRDILTKLVKFGGWITASNIISPMMVYFDRFVLSNQMGISNVAYYTLPAEIISKISTVTYSIPRALFPKLAKQADDSENILKTATMLNLIVVTFITIFLICFSFKLLEYWLGVEYAEKGYKILLILSIGYFFNSLAHIPYTEIQARGESKTTAIIHAIEIIPYSVLLYYGILYYGMLGAGFVWSLRMMIDFFVLMHFAKK